MVEEGTDPSNMLALPDELWKHTYDFRGFARLLVLHGSFSRLGVGHALVLILAYFRVARPAKTPVK
jgi:hypothetical protein